MMTRRRRHRLRPVLLVAVVTIAATACGDGDASGSSPDDECSLVELDTVDSAVDVAGGLGGETVADTEIHYTDGDNTVSLGGLDATMPMLQELDYYDPDSRNITIPPSWPTLDRMQLNSHSGSIKPTIGFAVFAQTTSVTVDGCREEQFDAYWELAHFTEAEEVHVSSIVDPETDVTCWTEVRYGRNDPGFDDSHRSVVLFAGKGIASSGVIMWGSSEYTEIPDDTGDLVDAVCGTRPEGL